MEIFKTFGLNLPLVVAQVVNFLIILYILKRFLYKPLFNMLQKREKMIKESLAKADESKKVLQKAEIQEKEIIKKARENANQILKDAREQSIAIIKQAEEETKKQTDRMVHEAKLQIEQDMTHAQAQLNKYVSKLSVELLKKSLNNVFTDEEQSEIVEKAVKELNKRPN